MGVVIISGSPRRNGNTELLLSIFEKELQKNNINTEFISLSGREIYHCINCDKCIGKNKCIQKDDFNLIYEKVLKNQGLVVGTPVYVGAPSSLLLAVIQRLTYVSYNNHQTLSKKIGAPIAVAGETGQLATINCLVDFYLANEMVIPSSTYWNIGFGVNKGDIKQDNNGKSNVIEFAKNLAWVMENLQEEI
jgi:multimeric flavodoxin WrbA